MNRKITVGLSFDFYPDGEHEELFEDMTEEETVRRAKEMSYDDIISQSSDLWRMLDVSVTEEGEN